MSNAVLHGNQGKTSMTGRLLVVKWWGTIIAPACNIRSHSALLCLTGLPKEVLVQILSHLPSSRSKLALLSIRRVWLSAMADPEVPLYSQLSMGPAAPKLQPDILAAIPYLEVTCETG